MIKKVTVTNYLNESMTYSLEAPTIDDLSGLLITSIDGLGPVKADIRVQDYTNSPGSIYNSTKVGTRNIVMEAYFTYAKTIEEARLMSYKYFPLGKPVKFEVETEKRTAYVIGYVESNEPNIFEELETCQISIICPNPYFKDSFTAEQETLFTNMTPVLYFPFYNAPGYMAANIYEPYQPDPYNPGAITPNQGATGAYTINVPTDQTEQIVMGEVAYKTENQIFYNGDAETGVKFVIEVTGRTENIIITDTRTGEYMKIGNPKGCPNLNPNGDMYHTIIMPTEDDDLYHAGSHLRPIDNSSSGSSQSDGVIHYGNFGTDLFPYNYFTTGDTIEICTIPRKKYAIVTKVLGNSVYVFNIIKALGKNPNWLTLKKGNNYLMVDSEVGEGMNMNIYVKNPIYYEGV